MLSDAALHGASWDTRNPRKLRVKWSDSGEWTFCWRWGCQLITTATELPPFKVSSLWSETQHRCCHAPPRSSPLHTLSCVWPFEQEAGRRINAGVVREAVVRGSDKQAYWCTLWTLHPKEDVLTSMRDYQSIYRHCFATFFGGIQRVITCCCCCVFFSFFTI